MIKLVNILEEGAILLSQLERNQVEEMLPKIIDAVKGPIVPENKLKLVSTIKYEFADKTLGEVKVYIGNDSPSSNAYFHSLDKNDPKDNIIVIQQNKFLPYFGEIGNTILKVNKFLVGDENTGIELLRKTLKHELIHAKDPALNHHYLEEPYDLNNPKVYYKSWREFQTITGQFFESIITGVDRILRSTKWPSEPLDKKINQIETALSEILNFFAGTSTFISQSTYDFIQNTKSRNILQQIFKFIDDIVGVSVGGNAFKTYNQYLRAIKRYHPEAYNEFLKDLYKIIDKSKNSVNMFLEKTREERKKMYRRSGAEIGLGSIPEPETVPSNIRLVKSPSMNSSSMFKSTNEIKRIQQLAGIQEGYYTTPTDDPKTAQLHLTTDEKPSLAKSYEPLSPKSKRTSQLTPEKVEDALITALRSSKMNYDKAIDTVSRKYSLDKDKLRKDFSKNDILYKAAPLEEIVNKVLEKLRMNEAEVSAEQAAKKGLNDFLGDLKSAASSIKPSPKDGEIKEGLVTLYSIVVGAPGILDLLGKGADLIGQYFSGGAVQKTQIGTALQKAGRELEHKYIEGIAYILKKAYPQSYKGDDVFDEKSALHDAAHGIYAALLAAGAIGAGWQAANATNLIIKGLEGGAAAFKSAEVVQLARKIVSA